MNRFYTAAAGVILLASASGHAGAQQPPSCSEIDSYTINGTEVPILTWDENHSGEVAKQDVRASVEALLTEDSGCTLSPLKSTLVSCRPDSTVARVLKNTQESWMNLLIIVSEGTEKHGQGTGKYQASLYSEKIISPDVSSR